MAIIDLARELHGRAMLQPVPTGKHDLSLTLQAVREVSRTYNVSIRAVEICALREGIIPERYWRNIGTIGGDGQLKLLESTVAVFGAGGLGGTIIELLARLGVGRLVLVDGDVFSENNLNRQLLAMENNLGQWKVEVAADRVRSINSGVSTDIHPVYADCSNIDELLTGVQIAVDALDNRSARRLLEAGAKRHAIPLVHGAIAGLTGQVMTIMPEDQGLTLLYGKDSGTEHGVESVLGNLTATPTMTAAWQVQEVVKLITGCGATLRKKLLYMDAGNIQIDVIELA